VYGLDSQDYKSFSNVLILGRSRESIGTWKSDHNRA